MTSTAMHPSRVVRALGLALALLSTSALAHGKDGVHVMGTVKEMKPGALVLTTKAGAAEEVMTDDNTVYEKSGQKVQAAELKVGEKAVVHGMKMPNGQVHATLVKFGKPPAKAPAKAATPAAGGEHSGHH